MLTAIIPDPHGPDFRQEVHGDNPKQLAAAAREFIEMSNYGASDVGSMFNTFRDGVLVGTLMYNGRFHWADPLYNPDHVGHEVIV